MSVLNRTNKPTVNDATAPAHAHHLNWEIHRADRKGRRVGGRGQAASIAAITPTAENAVVEKREEEPTAGGHGHMH